MIIKFEWNIKEKPEDFIVREVAEHEINDKGDFYLYRLIKKNFNTKDISQRYNLNYAGLKDKNAITFQYVTSPKFFGEHFFKFHDKDRYFVLSFLGRKNKKIKIGQLKGNYFSINLKNQKVSVNDLMINYFDTQRLSENVIKGKAILEKVKKTGKPKKKLNWLENFYLDAYLSYLWNKSIELFIQEKSSGYYIEENGHLFFIPNKIEISNLPKFWSILGYKVKINEKEQNFYEKILKKENFSLEEIINILKILKIKGDYRKSYIRITDVHISKNYLNFYLPKGAYATMYLKHIYKK